MFVGFDNKEIFKNIYGMFQEYIYYLWFNDTIFNRIEKTINEEVDGKYLLYLSTPHFHNNFVYFFEL